MQCTPLQVRHICTADATELESTKLESSQMSWRPWRTKCRYLCPCLNLGIKRRSGGQADRWHSSCRMNALLIQHYSSIRECVRESAVITRRSFRRIDIPGSSRSLEPSLSLICWLSLSWRSITQLDLRSKGQRNDVWPADYFRGSTEEWSDFTTPDRMQKWTAFESKCSMFL
jgi:hypothetical protein